MQRFTHHRIFLSTIILMPSYLDLALFLPKKQKKHLILFNQYWIKTDIKLSFCSVSIYRRSYQHQGDSQRGTLFNPIRVQYELCRSDTLGLASAPTLYFFACKRTRFKVKRRITLTFAALPTTLLRKSSSFKLSSHRAFNEPYFSNIEP